MLNTLTQPMTEAPGVSTSGLSVKANGATNATTESLTAVTAISSGFDCAMAAAA